MVTTDNKPKSTPTHKPIDWLKVGSIAGILVVIATILVPAYFYYIQRTDKALAYGVISQGPLVSVRDNLNGRLKILLDGKPIGSVNLIVLRVENTGTVAIRKADYDKPLSINFGPGSQVLGSEIISSRPTDLGETLKTTPQEIELDPVLMNKGDGFVVKALVNSPSPIVSLDGRIAEVTELRRVDVVPPAQATSAEIEILLLAIVGVLFFLGFLVVKVGAVLTRLLRESREESARWIKQAEQQKQEIDDQTKLIDEIDVKIKAVEAKNSA